jgi:hypothetical protein
MPHDSELAKNFYAIDGRQHSIENHNIRVLRSNGCLSLTAIIDVNHLIAF